MAELATKERLQPCLLDRLTDDEPEKSTESRDRRVFSLRQLRQAVLRDLSWLLNTPARGVDEVIERNGVVKGSYDEVQLPKIRAFNVMYKHPSMTKPAEAFEVKSTPLPPTLEWGQVLINVKAASIGPGDIHPLFASSMDPGASIFEAVHFFFKPKFPHPLLELLGVARAATRYQEHEHEWNSCRQSGQQLSSSELQFILSIIGTRS